MNGEPLPGQQQQRPGGREPIEGRRTEGSDIRVLILGPVLLGALTQALSWILIVSPPKCKEKTRAGETRCKEDARREISAFLFSLTCLR